MTEDNPSHSSKEFRKTEKFGETLSSIRRLTDENLPGGWWEKWESGNTSHGKQWRVLKLHWFISPAAMRGGAGAVGREVKRWWPHIFTWAAHAIHMPFYHENSSLSYARIGYVFLMWLREPLRSVKMVQWSQGIQGKGRINVVDISNERS